MLAEKCWDRDPSVRPHAVDVLFLFEAASSRWVPSTSETIKNLGLDRPATQRPPVTESTFTMSEAAPGGDRNERRDLNVVGSPHEIRRSSDGMEWFVSAVADLGLVV